MHRETVTADKGCYKTEASPAVSDKGRKDKRGGERRVGAWRSRRQKEKKEMLGKTSLGEGFAEKR